MGNQSLFDACVIHCTSIKLRTLGEPYAVQQQSFAIILNFVVVKLMTARYQERFRRIYMESGESIIFRRIYSLARRIHSGQCLWKARVFCCTRLVKNIGRIDFVMHGG